MYTLTVYTPSVDIFEAYWYGYGEVVEQVIDQSFFSCPYWKTVVLYGDDGYRAEYQQGRFQSGLYRAELEVL